ncbi:MAG: TIGR03905 family TSCPD domain-containing protein [Lachnospiraceae bacterium]|nr:TIGR03905 family TSCPD domain-containing protein [Lachnospiraceae bacterium]
MRYIPKGVCSQAIDIELDGEIIKRVQFTGGCHGNLQGIARLVEGMNANDAISKVRGIRCGFKSTSCPDQLANALEAALKQAQ